MEFIGRTKKLSDLEQEYNNSHSFVVIYGRRRCSTPRDFGLLVVSF